MWHKKSVGIWMIKEDDVITMLKYNKIRDMSMNKCSAAKIKPIRRRIMWWELADF